MLPKASLLFTWACAVFTAAKVGAFVLRSRERRRLPFNFLRLPSLEATVSTTTSASLSDKDRTRSLSVLLCPAQFCVPADYTDILEDLRQRHDGIIGHSVTVPLSRTDWIKVARQLPTKAFLTAKLPVEETLRWYFAAIEQGLADILANAEDPKNVRICIIGHSIGGWVARAYLGGLSQSSTAIGRAVHEGNLISSLITLGTPHVVGKNALVDQTRGLVTAIEATEACHPQALQNRGIAIACVASSAIQGKFMSTNLSELVAATSYGPLSGNWTSVGDGIVPVDLAFLESPAERIMVDGAEHIHVLPTPWNLWDASAPSIKLDLESYFGLQAMEKWTKFIR